MPTTWIARFLAALLLSGWGDNLFGLAAGVNTGGFPYSLRFWGTEGTEEARLPQSSVISIIQSRQGYLWLGTLNGLVRFDGLRFTVFDEVSNPELGGRKVVHIFEDSRQNLWIGTDPAGITVIDKSGGFRHLDLGTGRRGGVLGFTCEDTNGVVWLNTADGELARYASNRLESINGRFRPVMSESSGMLWLGTGGSLLGLSTQAGLGALVVQETLPVKHLDFLLASRSGGYWRMADGRIGKWKGPELERDLGPYPWGEGQVKCACEDLEGNLIVGTQDAGLFCYDALGKAIRISTSEGLSHNTVLSVCVDREGNVWAGTDGGGLNRLKKKTFQVAEGSLGLTLTSVCDDGQGGVWFGVFGGKLNHLQSGVLSQFDLEPGRQNPYVRSVFVDRDNTVWVGTTLGGLYVKEGAAFKRFAGSEGFGSITAIFQDHNGRLWLGTQRGLVGWGPTPQLYTTRQGLSADSVQAIAEDAQGSLWIGTEQGGLNRLRDGKFTTYRKQPRGLPCDEISALLMDDKGCLWIGTSSGLVCFCKGQWTVYTTGDGLASNGIDYLLEDGQDNLWIGSNAGLMKVSKNNLNRLAQARVEPLPCRVFNGADGLPTSECSQGSQPAACRTKDGSLWFPTIKGLVSVNPAQLRPNTNPPPVMIESVLLENEELLTNQLCPGSISGVSVPPGKEHLEIRYSALNLSAPERALFRYRLEGFESAWPKASNRRVASFPKLPPDRYDFHVRACNEDGVWSESSTSLRVTVLPAFWQTTAFRGGVIAALLAGVVATVYLLSTQRLQRQLQLLKQQEMLESERARIARDLHDQLGANLTQVALLGELAQSDKDSPADVEDHARQISQTARETSGALDEIVWAVNPLNDTLEGLVNYACKYAQEFLALADIRYRLELPPQLPSLTLAPEVRHNVFLAFKESVNNVVKHAQADSAWIRLRMEAYRCILEIEDNGRGMSPGAEQKGRNGLRNMRKRLEEIGGNFEVTPGAGQGTLVRLTIPIHSP